MEGGGCPLGVDELLLEDAGATTLADALAAGPFDVTALAGFALKLAIVLAGVNRSGVVHKDLNPANIVVVDPTGSGDLEPILIDFGLATTFAELRPSFTHPDEILGYLPYLAPEQTGRTGTAVGQRADLYAFGATLYELASGTRLFRHDDPLRLVRDILAEVPRPLIELAPGTPPGLSAVVGRLLEKEPDRRYQSADGLAHDLALLVSDPTATVRLGARDFPRRLSPPSRLIGWDRDLAALRDALDEAGRPQWADPMAPRVIWTPSSPTMTCVGSW